MPHDVPPVGSFLGDLPWVVVRTEPHRAVGTTDMVGEDGGIHAEVDGLRRLAQLGHRKVGAGQGHSPWMGPYKVGIRPLDVH